MDLINEGTTAWHFLGPWTGYIIGVTLAVVVIILNKKV